MHVSLADLVLQILGLGGAECWSRARREATCCRRCLLLLHAAQQLLQLPQPAQVKTSVVCSEVLRTLQLNLSSSTGRLGLQASMSSIPKPQARECRMPSPLPPDLQPVLVLLLLLQRLPVIGLRGSTGSASTSARS